MPEHFAELVLRVLDEEGAEAAAALMRRMLSADQGILLERTSGDVRRELLPWLTLEEISDILDEAPTESAVVITRELTAERAADLLDDVDSHTVVDILQELSDQQASAIVEELERPEDVVALLQYPSDSAGGMMRPIFPTCGGTIPLVWLWMRSGCSARTQRDLAGCACWTTIAV